MNENRADRKQARFGTQTKLSDVRYIQTMGMLLHDSAAMPETTADFLYSQGLQLGEGDYILLLFSIVSMPEMDAENYLSRFEKVSACLMDAEKYLSYAVEYDGRYCVLLSFRGKIQNTESVYCELTGLCKQAISQCQAEHGIVLAAYISAIAHGYRQISRVYDSLRVQMQYRMFLRKESGVTTAVMPQNGHRIFSLIDYGNTAAEIICGKIISNTDFHQYGIQILQDLVALPPYDKNSLRDNYAKVMEQIYIKLLERHIILPSMLSIEEFASTYLMINSWPEAEQAFHSFLAFASQQYLEMNQYGIAQRAGGVLSYVTQNYTDPTLTVETVAEALSMRSTTLCMAFKKEYGETLFSYINGLRLDQAAALLSSTEDSLSEICQKTGFGSVETLIRLFKKKYGTTPGKYRKNAQQSQRI